MKTIPTFIELRRNDIRMSLERLILIYGVRIAVTYHLGEVIRDNIEPVYRGGLLKSIIVANKELKRILALQQERERVRQKIMDNITNVLGFYAISLHDVHDDVLEGIMLNLNNIKQWIESNEFRHNYARLTYPSLLNPKTINYSNLQSKTAFYLNIPLPENYEFIFLGSNYGGHTAMIKTLAKCNINIAKDHTQKTIYENNYEICINKGYNVINTICYNGVDYAILLEKLVYLLPKRVPILYLVRDPIEKMRSYLNSYLPKRKYKGLINLENYNKKHIKDYGHYLIPIKKPLGNRIRMSMGILAYDSGNFLDVAKNHGFHDITVISMQDIMPDKIFSTLERLSKKFGFSIPLQRQEYEKKYIISYGGGHLFPVIATRYRNINIYIALKEYLNITESIQGLPVTEYIDILHYFTFSMPPFSQKISLITHKNDIHSLDSMQSYGELNKALKRLLDDIYIEVNNIESKKVSEEDILQALKEDSTAYGIFKEACKRNLVCLPSEILDSFSYYSKFLHLQ